MVLRVVECVGFVDEQPAYLSAAPGSEVSTACLREREPKVEVRAEPRLRGSAAPAGPRRSRNVDGVLVRAEIKRFLETARRKDARSVKIKKTSGTVKFKIRCSRYLYTLCVPDSEKADKLKQSLPPGLLKD